MNCSYYFVVSSKLGGLRLKKINLLFRGVVSGSGLYWENKNTLAHKGINSSQLASSYDKKQSYNCPSEFMIDWFQDQKLWTIRFHI